MVFYLVLRGLDTIEDDMSFSRDRKIEMLKSFHNYLDLPGWTFEECSFLYFLFLFYHLFIYIIFIYLIYLIYLNSFIYFILFYSLILFIFILLFNLNIVLLLN